MNDKITTETRTKQTPFNGWNRINCAGRTFPNDTKIKRYGKEINLQEFINENNKDCTIYDVLNTYKGDKKLTIAQLNKMHHKISDELAEIKDLPSAFAMMKAAETAWRELPLDIRKEFNNDVKNFQQNGVKWANSKIEEHNKKQQEILNKQKLHNQEIQNQLNKEVKNNG